MASLAPREFLSAVRNGDFRAAWYLHGPDDVRKEEALRYLVDRAVDPAMRDFNFDQRSAGQLDPEMVEALCNTMPMMAERRVVVIRDVEQWKRKTKARSSFLAYLERPAPDTVVVLVQGSGEAAEDKELAKLTTSVHFGQPTAAEAERWVERRAKDLGIAFAPGALEHLLNCTGGDLGALRLELEKLGAIAGGEPIPVETVGDLVGIRHGETIYDWRDAALDRNAARSVALLPRVLDQPGMSGVKLLTLLGTTLIGVAVVRAAYDRGARGGQLESAAFGAMTAARPFGLGSWKPEAARWARWAAQWPADALSAAIAAALDTDRALKSTTLSDERALLADLVMQMTLGPQVAA
ncbi:MAG TPA: DNA polymerase III subunit delta [Gemmatimonadales bacterium]